jgi:ArsR family transcriptional regulator
MRSDAAACCRPIDGLLDPPFFKALGEPTRVRLLACLVKCGRPCLVGELAECCSVDLSVVSRHLQTLARAGLVAASRHGRTVAYAVRHESVCARPRSLADAIEACRPESACGCPGGGHAPEDLDHDGFIGGSDLALLLANWLGRGVGDIDESGSVDGGDLARLLSAWAVP